MSYRIFISHKVERDKDIARILSDKLRLLSQTNIKVLTCEKTLGGSDWQHWIDENVSSCDMLLYLHTSDEQDLDWCWYEVGVFRGAQGDSRNLVCIKHPALKNPAHLSRYQSYDATHEGLKRFFKETINDGAFSGGKKFNDQLLDSDSNELDQTVSAIVNLFEERQATTYYFRKRLEIGPLTLDPLDPEQALLDAPVTANDVTRELLQLPNIGLKWKDVLTQFQSQQHAWVEDLQQCVKAIRNRGYPKQVMTPFETVNGRICYPVLGRVTRVKNSPVQLVVAFVEGAPTQPENEHTSDLARSPEPLNTILALLNLARRFRWNILSLYHARLTGYLEEDSNLREILAELNEAIARLMQEADKNDFLQPQHLTPIFGPEGGARIKSMFQDFYKSYGDLRKGIREADRELVLKCLEAMESLNKTFLLMAIDEYHNYVVKNVEPT